MSQFEEDVLFGCLQTARCWEMLHDPQFAGGLDAEQILDLAKAAGLSEETAQKMASERALARVRQGLSP